MVDKEKFRKIEQGRNKNQTCLEKIKEIYRTRINNSQQIGNRL